MPVVHLKEINSTNEYLKNVTTHAPMLIVADYQTDGRGQYGKLWESATNQNLTFSFQWHPKNLKVDEGFKISQLVSLVILETLNQFITPIKAYVKWPNDIIIKNKKVCGILIEPSIQNNLIQKVVVGIGLNVNQEIFPSSLSNAGSLKSLNCINPYDRSDLLKNVIAKLEKRLDHIVDCNLQADYNDCLLKLNQEVTLLRNGIKLRYINLGVNEQGHWMVRNIEDNQVLNIVSSREIEYVYM